MCSNEEIDCTPFRKPEWYVPDTPIPEIERKALEDEQIAVKCQKIWRDVKAGVGLFPEPNPLQFDRCPPPPPPPEPEILPDDTDAEWCRNIVNYGCRIARPRTESPSQASDARTMANKSCTNRNCDVETLVWTGSQPPPGPSCSAGNCHQRKCENENEPAQMSPICYSMKNARDPTELRLQEVTSWSCTPPPSAGNSNSNYGGFIPCGGGSSSNSCDAAPLQANNGAAVPKPNDGDCKKFLKFAQGQANFQKRELYDPKNKLDMQGNIKSCLYLGSGCFDSLDKKLADTELPKDCDGCPPCGKPFKCSCVNENMPSQWVKEIPEGCCDYRLSTLPPEFKVPAEDIDCPPMPDNTDTLIKPQWLECPPPSAGAPIYRPPVGVKIKPISKGIRTDFERNRTCLVCGAKRKDPFKRKCVKNLNPDAPAMRPRCNTIKAEESCPIVPKAKELANKFGIKW